MPDRPRCNGPGKTGVRGPQSSEMTDPEKTTQRVSGSRDRREVYRASAGDGGRSRVVGTSAEEREAVDDHTFFAVQTTARIDTIFYGRASRDRTGQRSSVTTQELK